jgi:hypothetical protein
MKLFNPPHPLHPTFTKITGPSLAYRLIAWAPNECKVELHKAKQPGEAAQVSSVGSRAVERSNSSTSCPIQICYTARKLLRMLFFPSPLPNAPMGGGDARASVLITQGHRRGSAYIIYWKLNLRPIDKDQIKSMMGDHYSPWGWTFQYHISWASWQRIPQHFVAYRPVPRSKMGLSIFKFLNTVSLH